MRVTRRDSFKILGGAALATLAGSAIAAKAKALRVLILGGTGFIGPHFVKALTDGGHKITLFNRGKRDPETDPGIEQLIGDRNGQIDALKDRDWDVVIDNSGYTPKQVTATAELLRKRVKQYIFISSIAVYADFKKGGIEEDYALAVLEDPTTDVVNGETYGGLKVLCEKEVERVYGKNATIIRPTYIAGPGDHTDRFTYWPWRVQKGGVMLAPGTPNDPFQYIDVRDLADFMRVCVERRVTGPYNLCNAQGSVTMGSLLDASKTITKSDATFLWASPAFLKAEKIIGEEAQGNYLPIWQAPVDDQAGLLLVSSARAMKEGLKFRTLDTTIRDTLEWQKSRPADKQTLRAGLPAEKEAELIAKLQAPKQ